jgi:mannan endo-1,4-beta-mannosidase
LSRALRAVSSAAITLAFLGAVAVFLGLQTEVFRKSHIVSHRPWPIRPSPAATVDIGVTTLPLARNSWRAWQPAELQSVNEFEHTIRKHVSVVMWYVDWAHSAVRLQQLEAVRSRGSIPEITWEPWDSIRGVRQQPRFRLRDIIDGRFDRYIRATARTIASYGTPVRLRFAQEMNGNWYPWSEQANGNRPHQFVRVWRHIHKLFDDAGARNVEWIWSPASITMSREQYPGDAYVNMVSLSVFNGGTQLRYVRWQSLASLLRRPLASLQRIAPGKPIELSEIGCADRGGNKAAWLRAAFATLRRRPAIKSIIWYDLVKWSDWRLESSREVAAASATGFANTRYR